MFERGLEAGIGADLDSAGRPRRTCAAWPRCRSGRPEARWPTRCRAGRPARAVPGDAIIAPARRISATAFKPARPAISASRDFLLDRAEDRMAGLVVHPDPHRVARLEERRRRLRRRGSSRPSAPRRGRNSPGRPRSTGLPGPPSASRLETVPEPMIVPAPRFRVLARWATKVPKSKVMSSPASARPNGCAVQVDLQHAAELAVRPGVAEFVRRDEHRRQRRGRLGLDESRSPCRARPG